MSVFRDLLIAAGLAERTVGAEFFGEEWHPVSTKNANSTDNVRYVGLCAGATQSSLRHDRAKAARAAPPLPLCAINNNLCFVSVSYPSEIASTLSRPLGASAEYGWTRSSAGIGFLIDWEMFSAMQRTATAIVQENAGPTVAVVRS